MINKVKFDMSEKFSDTVKQKLLLAIVAEYKIPVNDIVFNKSKGKTHVGFVSILINNKNIGQVNCHFFGDFKHSFSSNDINYSALRQALKNKIEDLINQEMAKKEKRNHLYSIPPCTWGSKLDVFVRKFTSDKKAFLKMDFQYKDNNWIIISTPLI